MKVGYSVAVAARARFQSKFAVFSEGRYLTVVKDTCEPVPDRACGGLHLLTPCVETENRGFRKLTAPAFGSESDRVQSNVAQTVARNLEPAIDRSLNFCRPETSRTLIVI